MNTVDEIIEKMNAATKAEDFQLVATLIEEMSEALTSDTIRETEECLSNLEKISF
jgi:hypothetical protein